MFSIKMPSSAKYTSGLQYLPYDLAINYQIILKILMG